MSGMFGPAAAWPLALALAACSGPLAAPQAPSALQASGATPSNLPPDSIRVLPSAAGWNTATLEAVLSYAAEQKSTGLLVIDDGRIIAERYWPLPADSQTFETSFVHGRNADGVLLEDVASQQKSFIAILVGVAVDKGLLDLNKPVTAYLGPGWTKAAPDQEAAISVLNLLEMNSGLTEGLAFEAPAGARFFYNTPAYARLKPVLEKASGQTLDTLTREWLTAPAGMSDTSWRRRPGGFAGADNPTGLVTTPRDVAKMGQLVLDRGLSPAGTRIISNAQLDAMLARTATNPAYGRLWWINGGAWRIGAGLAATRAEGPLIASAPADLIAAQGAQDRKLFVSPSRRVIVVRMGQAAERDFNDRLWTLLSAAMPPA
jgi:CubicO group peptidase (beta-lactamase class C family)